MTNYSYSNEYVGQLIDMLYKVKNYIPEEINSEVDKLIDSTKIHLNTFDWLSEVMMYAPFEYAKEKFEEAFKHINYEHLPEDSKEFVSKCYYWRHKNRLNMREELKTVKPEFLIYKMYKEYINVYSKLKDIEYPSLNKFENLGYILKKNSPIPLMAEHMNPPVNYSLKNMNVNEVITKGKQIIKDSKEYDEVLYPELNKEYFDMLINSMLVHIRKIEECFLGCPVHPTGKKFK